jgi:REP element-mobilizing transposase RayT
MPQKRIPLQPEHIYHIWTHANGDDNLFRSEDNYIYFLDRYRHHIHPVVETYAYCLMPNHLHLMVKVREEKEIVKRIHDKDLTGFGNLSGLISKQFSNLFNGYTKAFNKMYGRKGSLFMRPFNRKLINSDEYFVRLIAYIHNNPVNHGFASKPSDWSYSSWHAYVLNKLTKIKKDEALQWFGEMKNFKTLHLELNTEKCIQLFES